ncbi:MAG: hypothetical protein KFF46_09860, partial [Desulfobacterales bacterium]|nr:hypothetical protein [Desulfobacterales bacterium]
VAGRKKALRPGPGFFAPEPFCAIDPMPLPKFTNPGLRPQTVCNFSAKILNVASKTRPMRKSEQAADALVVSSPGLKWRSGPAGKPCLPQTLFVIPAQKVILCRQPHQTSVV